MKAEWVSIDKLLQDLLKLADLVLYNCDSAGTGRITVSENVADYLQSDDFLVVGKLARGEAIIEEQAELIEQVQALDATIRQLRNRIVQLEEVEGNNRELAAINAKLVERIKGLQEMA